VLEASIRDREATRDHEFVGGHPLTVYGLNDQSLKEQSAMRLKDKISLITAAAAAEQSVTLSRPAIVQTRRDLAHVPFLAPLMLIITVAAFKK